MRYTLPTIQAWMAKILEGQLNINAPVDGYSILHAAAIELRDEEDQHKRRQYYELIKQILNYPDCDPNVVDKHKKPLLAYASEEDDKKLVLLLLKHNADPNFVAKRDSWTSLEWAIYTAAKRDIIDILNSRTRRTARMLQNCNELFEEAVENNDVTLINTMLDLGLVQYTMKFNHNLFKQNNYGFWVRLVSDPQREYDMLCKREQMTDDQLSKLRHTHSGGPNYTPYSPATFVRAGVPISLFGCGDSAGLIIRPSKEAIAYWYDGHREELSMSMSYSQGSRLTNGQRSGEYHELSAAEVKAKIEENYWRKIEKCLQKQRENPEEFDRHGVLLDKMLCENVTFSWNEGLLRYKHKNIDCIQVNITSKKSCFLALQLAQTLKLQVPFYFYDAEVGSVREVDKAKLMQQLSAAEQQELLRGDARFASRYAKPAPSPMTQTFTSFTAAAPRMPVRTTVLPQNKERGRVRLRTSM